MALLGLGISHDGGAAREKALGVVLHVGTGAGGGAAIVGAIYSGGSGGLHTSSVAYKLLSCGVTTVVAWSRGHA
eukprot:scaffold14476_cov120-Isochrysis_galbana.AAC.6